MATTSGPIAGTLVPGAPPARDASDGMKAYPNGPHKRGRMVRAKSARYAEFPSREELGIAESAVKEADRVFASLPRGVQHHQQRPGSPKNASAIPVEQPRPGFGPFGLLHASIN